MYRAGEMVICTVHVDVDGGVKVPNLRVNVVIVFAYEMYRWSDK